MKDLINYVTRNGVRKENGNSENYQITGTQAWRYGNTIYCEDCCINDYGSIFQARGNCYELTFAPSELEGIPQGYLGAFRDEE
jgi:hypothetical protein